MDENNEPDELSQLLMKKREKKEDTVTFRTVSEIIKIIPFKGDEIIEEAIKKHSINYTSSQIFQTNRVILNICKRFNEYSIMNGDEIFILPAPDPAPFIIYCYNGHTGKVHCIHFNHLDTVLCLQREVEKYIHINIQDQILIYEGKSLDSRKTLQEENILNASVVIILDKKCPPTI